MNDRVAICANRTQVANRIDGVLRPTLRHRMQMMYFDIAFSRSTVDFREAWGFLWYREPINSILLPSERLSSASVAYMYR